MIIISSVSLASISLFLSIHVLGPSLCPFAPYGMPNHFFLSR
ncbi:hypothetical protein AMTRI_Chr08g163880 [Amborella trichopoda]